MQPEQLQSPDAGREYRDDHAPSSIQAELAAGRNPEQHSPRATSPTSGNGAFSLMPFGPVPGHSGSTVVSGPSGCTAGHSAHYGMPVQSSSLLSPTALQAASREGIMESRLTLPRGASGAFSSADAYMHRGAVGSSGAMVHTLSLAALCICTCILV
jgi:hypothetical protein